MKIEVPFGKEFTGDYFCLSMMHKVRLLFVVLVLSLFTADVTAQDSLCWAGRGIEINPFVGKVIKHSHKFHLPIPEMSTGVDINIISQKFGRKDWEQRRRYPQIGLGITYTNYGIDSVYGRCLGIYPNILMYIIRGKKLEWTMRIGDGIAYVSHRYGRFPISDTLNNAIGSRINDYFSFNSDVRFHFNEHWDVQAGVNFSHISDASYHQPNLGVNLAGGHVGIRYFPETRTPKHIHKDLKPLKSRILIEGRYSMAFTQSEASQGPLYPVYMGAIFASKRWISKNKAFLGLDYSYHEGIYAFLRNNEILPGEEAAHSYKTAIIFGNEFLLGRVGAVLQVGVYLKKGALPLDAYYEKLGANLYLIQKEHGPIKELFLTGLLKTHRSIAELAEFGVGVGF